MVKLMLEANRYWQIPGTSCLLLACGISEESSHALFIKDDKPDLQPAMIYGQ
jgi:hypothetical protein